MGAPIDVVAAILIKNSKVLIAQRAEDDPLAGFWEFPGGKIEPGESPEQSLIREMQEEFCIDIEVNKFFGNSTFEYEKGLVRLLAYMCTWSGGEIRSTVHHDYAWVEIDELNRYDFAPADQPLVEKLRSDRQANPLMKSITLDMGGTSRKDFISYFLNLGGRTEDKKTITGSYWEVVIGPDTPAKLSSFSINRVLVTFNVEEDKFNEFIARFNMKFIRAGG